MGKVAGIASVRVSLNEGLTVLELKPANTVTLSSLRQVIRNNGFVTKEAAITVRGTVDGVGDQLILTVPESKERLILRSNTSAVKPYDELRARLQKGAPVDVIVNGHADITDPKSITLTVNVTQSP